MGANAAIYVPGDSIALAGLADWIEVVGGTNAYVDCVVGGDAVRFNVLGGDALQGHLRGMRGWIRAQGLPGDEVALLDAAVSSITAALGMVTAREFTDNARLWQCLFVIAGAGDGMVFAAGSLLSADGTVLCGALREH